MRIWLMRLSEFKLTSKVLHTSSFIWSSADFCELFSNCATVAAIEDALCTQNTHTGLLCGAGLRWLCVCLWILSDAFPSCKKLVEQNKR